VHIGCIREPAFRRSRYGRCFRVPGERSLREVPRLNLRVLQTYSHPNASGPATENLIVGELHHQPSGVNYRIYSEDGKVWLSFERPGDPSVSGTRQLLYYIGQGRRGRTYLFSVDAFVFESPVNWYADRHMWARWAYIKRRS
jgi:hypothetical protein